MSSPRLQNKKYHFTAWLLMLVCAWMGTGGVLHHTEASAQPHHKTASRLHAQTLAADDTCAACEWTQGLQGHTLAVCCVSFPLFLLPAPCAAARPPVLVRVLHHRPSRAPPVSFSFC